MTSLIKTCLSRCDGWTIVSLGLAGLLMLPVCAVAWLAFFPTENIWPHLWRYALPIYLGNTLVLMFLVSLGAAIVGTGTAWLIAMTEFPGRRWLELALLAPLAVPAYIGAYALVDFLEYAGPLQTGLRHFFGWQSARDYWFPEIRSLGSAVIVLTFSLYPYVYLLARAAFREQSVCALEVGRALGCGPWGVFWRVGLPLARPAVAAGTAIVCMETLNDFGAVDYFSVPTLTRGIFAIWLESYNAGGAAQISMVMLGFVVILIGVERFGRRGRRYHHTSRRYRPIERAMAGPRLRWVLFGLCATPVLVGFAVPSAIISYHALHDWGHWHAAGFWRATWHTGVLATVSAVLACAVGVIMTYGARNSGRMVPRWLAQSASLGYAIPGAVLAIGIMMPMSTLDHWLADLGQAWFSYDMGLLMTGSAAAIVFAYIVRFSAIAYGAVDGALGRITPSMEHVARTLGSNKKRTLMRIHVPIIRGSILTAGLLVFVDAVKELPATLILRPFNYETLASTVYNAASIEQLERATPAALAIILVGMLPVAILAHQLRRSRAGEGQTESAPLIPEGTDPV